MNKINVEIDADKLNAIRRKLSFQENRDLTNQETVDLMVESAYKGSVPKTGKPGRPRYVTGQHEVKKLIQSGATSTEAMKKLGVSRSTFFRHKAKERKLLEESE